ncbi:dTDP-4-dehydrorhamnose reductase [Rouxiella sp. Mn2063]|uniref:dTDP-4-dehydrorhamnose reductase n=1 Tax=Rouxiella sp. Mn2063 TaxID=3395262 RepID=UPI003BE5E748
MKLLIVGCSGQVGSELVNRVSDAWDVYAFDRKQLDITNYLQVGNIIKSILPDVIINASAYTAVDRAETEIEQAFAINSGGVANLALEANNCGAKFLHISTDYVFRGDREGLYSESDETEPTGIYGKSKLAGELAISEICKRHIILRTSWVFGQHGNNFVKTMIRIGEGKTSLNVVGDQFGGPTYAGDIANALLLIAEKVCEENFNDWGIYHYSGAPYTNWANFANVILELAHKNSLISQKVNVNSITSSEYPTPAKRPINSMLDCTKIHDIFNIGPSQWELALRNIEIYAK